MMRSRRQRLIGLAFALVPVTMFAVFAVGEAGSESGWWGHLVQLAAAALALALAWRWPQVGGPVMALVGAALGVLMLREGGESLSTKLLTVGIFFAPLVVAGAFFTLAGWASTPPPADRLPHH